MNGFGLFDVHHSRSFPQPVGGDAYNCFWFRKFFGKFPPRLGKVIFFECIGGGPVSHKEKGHFGRHMHTHGWANNKLRTQKQLYYGTRANSGSAGRDL